MSGKKTKQKNFKPLITINASNFMSDYKNKLNIVFLHQPFYFVFNLPKLPHIICKVLIELTTGNQCADGLIMAVKFVCRKADLMTKQLIRLSSL